MFEKEAKEWADKLVEKGCVAIAEDRVRQDIEYTFRKSAEFGYNKALEAGGPKWHKVADGDRPPLDEGCSRASVLAVNEYGRIMMYDYGSERWRDYEGDILDVQPEFWCEIPKYTKE